MVEQPCRLFCGRPECWSRPDEIPRLVRRNLEAILPVDKGGRHTAGRVSGVRLYAVGHEIPARHALEDLSAFVVLADCAQDERVRAKAPEVPRHVERSASKNAATVREVVEKDLAKDDGSVVGTMHGLAADGFLGAGGHGPR